MPHPNDFSSTVSPAKGDGIEGSLHKINAILAAIHQAVPFASTVPVHPVTIAATAGTLESLGGFTFDAKTKNVIVIIETAPVRMEPSGATPTASVGLPVVVGQPLRLSLAEARAAKWIRTTGSSATAQVYESTI